MKLASREKAGIVILVTSAILALVAGWRLFWFLTDDAYIAFRYVSNSILGYGYVWNPPPFRPVEGYTSFLWVVLLDGVWRITGIEPPDSANVIALIFSVLTLLLGLIMVFKINFSSHLEKYRVLFAGFVVIGVISNRTFLAWTSSGLETAMFNFYLTGWIYCCVFFPFNSRLWIAGVSLSATLLYLTRPDGMLFIAASLIMISIGLLERAIEKNWSLSAYIALISFIAIPVHLAWRKSFYGEWLPNTYYAKTVVGKLWLTSGIKYFLSFVIEYALWIWLALLFALILKKLWQFKAIAFHPILHKLIDHHLMVRILVISSLLGQFLYYTLIIGGDHFEYRVYSHSILLLFISFLWMLNKIQIKMKLAVIIFVIFLITSWIIPWTHWSASQNYNTRKDTLFMRISVAEVIQNRFPAVPMRVLGYFSFYDKLQHWLISHAVGMRHQEHKVFYQHLISTLSFREQGLLMLRDKYPIIGVNAVGVRSWVLPYVNVIDLHGLNDYIIARNPDLHSNNLMAHSRKPPSGYLECFSPNVIFTDGSFVIQSREIELTAEKISECEEYYSTIEKKPNRG